MIRVSNVVVERDSNGRGLACCPGHTLPTLGLSGRGTNRLSGTITRRIHSVRWCVAHLRVCEASRSFLKESPLVFDSVRFIVLVWIQLTS